MVNLNIKEGMQKFGAAMFVPVLLFSFSGLLVGLTTVFKNESLVGAIANPDGLFHKFMTVLSEGGWTVFRNMSLLFCIGIPIGMSRQAPERAIMATLVCFLSFNYFISSILGFWGPNFGVDFSKAVGGVSGLTMMAGIKTLDTSIIGGILIGFLVTKIHNRFYETALPDYLGIFQGTSFVHIISFFTMIPLAFLTCLIWPKIQVGINSMQSLIAGADFIGVWIYTFLERFLIPTGLHHFIYGPFGYGPAIVPNGIHAYWMDHISEFAAMTEPLKEIFPGGGFRLHGNSKVFGLPGAALAIYFCSKEENRKTTAALLIPATLTSVIVGVTEPLEFTFLFIAPFLFLVHSILAATMVSVMYIFGVVGNMGGGLLEMITLNWIFTAKNHLDIIIIQIIIGFIFMAIYFMVFKFLILKFDIKTPGRNSTEIKLYGKSDYKSKQSGNNNIATSEYEDKAIIYLNALGGSKNIESVTNCATRLRVTVKDDSKVADLNTFKAGGAHGLVRDGKMIQVIVGLSVPIVRTKFEELLKK